MDPFMMENTAGGFGFNAIGLGLLLLQNKAAKDYYDSLSDDERKEFNERTGSFKTEGEMRSFIDTLTLGMSDE